MYGNPAAKAPFQKTEGKKQQPVLDGSWCLVGFADNPRHLLGTRVTAPQLNSDSLSSQLLNSY